MDWNLKTPSWDYNAYEQETIPNIGDAGGSNSYLGQGTRGDFSVDSKLGNLVEGDSVTVPKMMLSPSGSSKRARPRQLNNGVHTAMCLVDGCNADLSNCREYHRRHKVCEAHSKTPEVKINGNKQRFCQQCSRFHSLEEFDEGKRSCRKRLDGHNRRRRKPQPEPLSHSGSFFPGHQGTRMFQFYTPQADSSTPMTNPIWAGMVKTEEDNKLYNHHSHSSLPEYSLSLDKREKQHSFMNNTNLVLSNQSAAEPSVCQPLLNNIASSASGGTSSRMYYDGFSTRVVHSDCALSLLSSSSTHTNNMGSGLALQPNSIPGAHPLDSGLHYNNQGQMLVPNVGDADVNCLEMFQAPNASRGNNSPQTLPFYWE
ncbi:hypothetical protein ACET3Z_007561 [Daucus carota]